MPKYNVQTQKSLGQDGTPQISCNHTLGGGPVQVTRMLSSGSFGFQPLRIQCTLKAKQPSPGAVIILFIWFPNERTCTYL
jgi:hypothetical protein